MNPFERKIATMIGAICRHWRRRQMQCFGIAAGAGLLIWLFVMAVADNLLMLSTGQLLIGWGVVLIMIVVGLAALALRLTVVRPAADRLALMYEARLPQQRNRLINAVQFIAARKTRRDPLAQVAIAENAMALHLRTAADAVDSRPVRRLLLTLAIVAAAWGVYTVVWPSWMANGLSRLLQPLHPGVHLLATDPIVSPGDVELVEGQSLTVEAEVPASRLGTEPRAVRLEYSVGDLGWMQAWMSAADGGDAADERGEAMAGSNSFSHTFPAIWHPMDYRVRAGRSVSTTFHVRVQPRPRVQELQVTVKRPAYAGGQIRRLKPNVGDVAALAGSSVGVSLVVSTPLSGGCLERQDGSTVPLRGVADEPTRATARFELRTSGTYAIRLTDQAGLSNVNPPRYSLTAEPDQAPLAVITQPGRDLILPTDAQLSLSIEAEDDIGLGRVVLQTRWGEGDWNDQAEFTFSPESGRRQTITTSLALADFGLQVNDVLLYRAVAYDHCVPEPNTGIGRTWSVAIAPPDEDGALLAAQHRRLLEALEQILALQRQNRTAVDLDRSPAPLPARQRQIRDLTLAAIATEQRALRPNEGILAELVSLADGPMLKTIQQLADFDGPYKQRLPLKPPILALMDEIIVRLEALIGQVRSALARAERAQEVLADLPEAEREQALARIRDLLAKLRDFIPEQDQVITDTEELVRRGDDLTDEDLQKIEQLKGTEDEWAETLVDSVKDIEKLTEQGFADRSIANDYKEMVEQIEEASLNLTPELVQLAIPREQAGRELAESLVEEMEMWLPNSPDYQQWIMEEPLDFPEIPMVDLPDQLWDYIGELIEDQDDLNEAAEDMTSAWADSLAEGAGWEVAGGPISNFSAVGKTGNQLPDNNELSGRSGEGRSGRSQGQLVENVAKGLQGRKTPTRITNDAYEQGVVKELQQMATGGATGGGKARGAGQEGLQGESPPPMYQDLQYMREWQKRIRQKAQRVAGQLQMVRINIPGLERSIELMRDAEQAAVEGRYAEMFKIQQMVLQTLRVEGELAAREVALRVERAYRLPVDQRREILDAMDEPVPREYQDAVRRYFQRLSEAE